MSFASVIDVMNKTEELADLLDTVTLANSFPTHSTGKKLKMIAKLMKLNEERKVNRDVFYFVNGGHDGHSLAKENVNQKLPDISSGIEAFYNEMKDSNLLNSVTFVMLSEFGRTITPNAGRGSDHAWGGNTFIWGGDINGTRILGEYPSVFDNTYEYNVGRGFLIPYRSWDSLWYGVANWFGITSDEDMRYVLPNNGNMGVSQHSSRTSPASLPCLALTLTFCIRFQCQLYTDKDMYNHGTTVIDGCNDRYVEMKLSMLLNEPRYLTGLEQKRLCAAAISLVSQNANVTSRCIVVDQTVIVNFSNNARRVLAANTNLDPRILTEVANFTIGETYCRCLLNCTLRALTEL